MCDFKSFCLLPVQLGQQCFFLSEINLKALVGIAASYMYILNT